MSIRKEWIDVLRSGKYLQCFGAFEKLQGTNLISPMHCAVGCILKENRFQIFGSSFDEFNTAYKKLGIPEYVIDRVMKLNDEYRYSFRRIANILEEGSIWEIKDNSEFWAHFVKHV